MSQVVVLLWFGASALEPAYETHLHAWAAARQVTLVEPERSGGWAYRRAAVDEVEALLEQARIAFGSLDVGVALARLEDAKRVLLARPQLPQSAWLLGEVLQLQAEILAAEPNRLDEVKALLRQARRLAGFREHAYTSRLSRIEPKEQPAGRVRIVSGVARLDEVEIDGRIRAGDEGDAGARSIALNDGQHHLRVLRHRRLMWAGWIYLDENTERIALNLPPVPPCSLDDLSQVELSQENIVAEQVNCPRWAVAKPNSSGGVDIASCVKDGCGPFLSFRKQDAVLESTGTHEHAKTWPAWLTYLAVGVGAAAVTSAVLWQAGVFDPREPGSSYWVYEGLESRSRSTGGPLETRLHARP